MTKQMRIQPGMLKANGELDLSNPDLVQQLQDASVTDAKADSEPLSEVEEKQIKELESLDEEVTIKLSKDQISGLMRRAAKLSIDWKEYLSREIQEQLFTKNVGKPLITQASWGKPVTKVGHGHIRTISPNDA